MRKNNYIEIKNMLPKNQWVKEEIKKEFKKYLETMIMKKKSFKSMGSHKSSA